MVSWDEMRGLVAVKNVHTACKDGRIRNVVTTSEESDLVGSIIIDYR